MGSHHGAKREPCVGARQTTLATLLRLYGLSGDGAVVMDALKGVVYLIKSLNRG